MTKDIDIDLIRKHCDELECHVHKIMCTSVFKKKILSERFINTSYYDKPSKESNRQIETIMELSELYHSYDDVYAKMFAFYQLAKYLLDVARYYNTCYCDNISSTLIMKSIVDHAASELRMLSFSKQFFKMLFRKLVSTLNHYDIIVDILKFRNKEEVVRRCQDGFKAELIAKAWHPRRHIAWCLNEDEKNELLT